MDSKTVISNSGIAFGTSGARGLVEDFTADVSAAFSLAFVTSIEKEFTFDTVAIAIDNRPSSYSIAQACAKALEQRSLNVVFYGVIPTPAMAYKAMKDSIPSIMVTGSHIPFDRNGLKFYRPDGEITKADEKNILCQNVLFTPLPSELPTLVVDKSASDAYELRYLRFFEGEILRGKKIGIYEHSSAGRDLYRVVFEKLGADVVSLGRSDEFVPIDTEAVSEEDKQRATTWSKEYGLDVIFSTDGDGDRPLIADENGNWLRGDVLGLLCSQLLGVEALAVPVSCNTAIEKSNIFKKVMRTEIGSPFVIDAFNSLRERFSSFSGFEANGGYILGSDIKKYGKILEALPTRDALLPALVLIANPKKISALLENLPSRFTMSNRIQNFETEKSLALIKRLRVDAKEFLSELGYRGKYETDVTDGLRIILECGDIIHLRASGNAPELRCYVESSTLAIAQNTTDKVIELLSLIR
ncbi:phosphomannomutase [Vibrio alginolyticus]|uniref:phosphomannomutase n=1 Tax=Vibrio alginolyticus TaxID=663 RepID=UPI0037552D06